MKELIMSEAQGKGHYAGELPGSFGQKRNRMRGRPCFLIYAPETDKCFSLALNAEEFTVQILINH